MPQLLAVVTLVLVGLQGGALGQRRSVHLVAERFSFTPSRVEVEAGEAIELVITSDDTAHGLRIAGTGIDRTIPKRGAGELRVTLMLEQPGRYAFECSRMCGAGHGFMRGELVVRPPRGAAGGR